MPNVGDSGVSSSAAPPELASFFTGLDLVNPGVLPILTWHPDGDVPAGPLPRTATRRRAASHKS